MLAEDVCFCLKEENMEETKRIEFNPNRSLDTPSPFLIGKVRLSGILPASVRILILEKHAA